MAEVGNWVTESCSTNGTGDLTLTGAYKDLATFLSALPAGLVWYSIEDGANREAGIGTFDGASTIERTTVQATLFDGTYNDSSPSAIDLSGNAIVSCTWNKSAYDELRDAIVPVTAHIADGTIHFTKGSIGHTEIADIGTNTHTQIDSHIADATIHYTVAAISITKSQVSDFVEADYATGAEGDLAATALQDITGESIKTLSDVFTTMAPTNGQVLTYNTTNGWQSETPVSGVTDHTLLTNIGTNTHAQIDTHIADGTIHFTQASIVTTGAIDSGSITSGFGAINIGTSALTCGALTSTGIASLTEIIEAEHSLTGTVLDPANGSVQYKTLAANTTFTESLENGQSVTLMIDDGTAYTITWPTITWVNNAGAAPTLATTGYTVITIWQTNGTLYGALIGDGT